MEDCKISLPIALHGLNQKGKILGLSLLQPGLQAVGNLMLQGYVLYKMVLPQIQAILNR